MRAPPGTGRTNLTIISRGTTAWASPKGADGGRVACRYPPAAPAAGGSRSRSEAPLARSSTVYRFEIDVSDTDRDHYAPLELRVARHPSESTGYLLTRVLAYALNAGEGIAFTTGLSTPDEPAILVRDLTGAITHWIEVGQPSPERLQKALGQSAEVAVYTYKSPEQLTAALRAAGDARLDAVRLYAIDPAFLARLEADLDRRNRWTLVRSEGVLYVTTGDRTHEGELRALRLDARPR